MYSIFAFGSSAALLWSCPAVPARQRWCAGRRGGSIFSVLQLSGTPLPAMIVSLLAWQAGGLTALVLPYAMSLMDETLARLVPQTCRTARPGNWHGAPRDSGL